MKNIIHSILFGFRELLSWTTAKYALIGGFIVTALWAGIGAMLWPALITLSTHILELVPFSMVRSNGAWMLSSFLWLQAVLLTFALILVFFGNIILRKISREKYTGFTLLLVAGSALFWSLIWMKNGTYIYQQFLKLLTWLPFETIEKGIAFLIGIYIIYNAIVVTWVFITSLFSETLLSSVEHRHFGSDTVRHDHLFSSIGYTIRDALIFLGASIILFPLLFVPVLNILVQIALWMWLIKDTMAYDAAALVFEKVDKDTIKQHRFAVWSISGLTALFNFVPLLNLLGPFFGEIALYHYEKTVQNKE